MLFSRRSTVKERDPDLIEALRTIVDLRLLVEELPVIPAMMDRRTKGLHLMVDGLTDTAPTLASVRRFIGEVVEKVDLKIIAGPFFFELADYSEAFAIIAESHVSVKWWPGGLVLMDLFSCKPFGCEGIIGQTVKHFGLEHWRPRVIERMGVG